MHGIAWTAFDAAAATAELAIAGTRTAARQYTSTITKTEPVGHADQRNGWLMDVGVIAARSPCRG